MAAPLPPMGGADTHPWSRCPNCRADAVKNPPAGQWPYACSAGYRWDDGEQRWVPNAACPEPVR